VLCSEPTKSWPGEVIEMGSMKPIENVVFMANRNVAF